MQFLTELTTSSDCSQLLSVVLLYLRMHWIPHGLCGTAYSSVWREERAFCVENLAVFFLPPFPLYFPLFISVTGACLIEGVGAHGWFVRFCQPSVQSPSWSWLPTST